MSISAYILTVLTLGQPSVPADNDQTPVSTKNKYIFFRPDGIGAHAFHTPWATIIESGFEEYGSRPLSQLDLFKGHRNVFSGLIRPREAIENYGVDNFIYQQLLPGFWVEDSTPSYLPNYLWHLIGGGFRFRQMMEYYEHNNYSHPQLMSWLTLYTGHWLNEAVQAQKFSQGSADALADLFLFDWLGKILFLSTPVAEFFAEFFHLKDWTFQTFWDPLSNSLVNTGQLYWARLPLYWGLSLSTITGHTVNAVNLTYSGDEDQTQWTLGMGLQASGFTVSDNDDLSPTAFQRSLFLSYSELDNPLVVIVAKEALPGNDLYQATPAGTTKLRPDNYALAPSINISIYPKWLELFEQKLAVSVLWEREAFFVGIGAGPLPIGLSLSTPLQDKYSDDY